MKFDARRKYRLLAALAFFAVVSCLLVFPQFVSNGIQSAQTRRRAGGAPQTTQRRPVVRAQNKRGTDYSVFLHDQNHVTYKDAAKKISNCTDCHTAGDAKSAYNIVDYPDHNACITCHRQQFYRGARPLICANCHTQVSPRNGARFEFTRPMLSADVKPIFPHAKHDADKFDKNTENNLAQSKAERGGSCRNCHVLEKNPSELPADWIIKGKEKPDTKGTFMDVPASVLLKNDTRFVAHAACIKCHADKKTAAAEPYIDPQANQCAQCHGAASIVPHDSLKKADISRYINGQLRPNLQDTRIPVAFLNVPLRWSYRISPKFRHENGNHDRAMFDDNDDKPKNEPPEKTCATCHAGIQGSDKLEELKKVSIGACYYCHTEKDDTLTKEVAARKKDAKFNCTYCHTSKLGTGELPASHTTKPTPPPKKK